MGGQEQAKCSICENVDIVLRKYYCYSIDCECCVGDRHFEIVKYCKNCTPKPPEWVKAAVKPV